MDCPGFGDTFRDKRSRADDNTIWNGHTQGYERLRTYPDMFADDYWLGVELEILAVVVVRATTKMSSLGYHAVASNLDQIHIVDCRTIGNSYMITKL